MPRYVAKMGRSDGAVRDTRSQTVFGTRPVELITSDPRGDQYEGHMRVPLRLVGTKPHTNERLEFKAYVTSQIKRWVEWREHKGWKLNSMPKVRGPYAPATADQDAEVPDWKLFIVTAQFKPTGVILAGLTDISELERRAAMHGIDLWQPRQTVTPEGPTRSVIYDDTPVEDPLVVAEARRQALGVKRSDYLIGAIDAPMSEADLT